MSETSEKVKKSIERIKAFCPPEGYYLAFSGGKDSVVCKALLDMAGVKYDAHYRVTSVDPPELVRFIRDQHPDVTREIPRYSEAMKNENLRGKPITMWNLIPEHGIPTRLQRFCCQYLKEDGGDGRMTVTGVRWAESKSREENQGVVTVYKSSKLIGDTKDFRKSKKGGLILVNDNTDSRRFIESCYKRRKTTLNPIIEWTDSEVWEFIRAENIPYCQLYNEGFYRLGCIGCPLATNHSRAHEFQRWPKYKAAYLYAFQVMLKERARKGKPTVWKNPIEVFNWWMENGVLPDQYTLDGIFDE